MDTTAEAPGQNPNSYLINKIPRDVQFTSPVSLAPMAAGTAVPTPPLNIVALIVSYLDDAADLARVTRTCRLLHYMALPHLYSQVSLHSYPEMRYINGRPEGYGSGSPFTMALNGLVTKTYASLVGEFRIWGQWRELGVEDFALGRVPDSSMMLNTLVRAAIDKMGSLRRFSWELDSKPLRTLYQGLAARDTLTRLTIRFPSSRVPRPRVLISPIPNLRAFKALDIDPLCYPDDMSLLLFQSRKLQDLRLHFSPRMRREAEPSLSLESLFGRSISNNYKLKVKHFAMHHYFGPNSHGMDQFLDHNTCQSCTFLDTFGGSHGSSKNVFLDDTWKVLPENLQTSFKHVRVNETASQHVSIISKSSGMESCVFVGAKTTPPRGGDMPGSGRAEPRDGSLGPVTPGETPPRHDTMVLGREYLFALTRHHGASLKVLLLSDQWAFLQPDLNDLTHYCKNLEQLGIGLGCFDSLIWQLLLVFLPKMHTLRILQNDTLQNYLNSVGLETLLDRVSYDSQTCPQLRWLGIGDRVFKVGGYAQSWQDDGSSMLRRELVEGNWEEQGQIELWKLDVLDIDADPIAADGI